MSAGFAQPLPRVFPRLSSCLIGVLAGVQVHAGEGLVGGARHSVITVIETLITRPHRGDEMGCL